MNIQCSTKNPIIRNQVDFNVFNDKIKSALKYPNIDISIYENKVIIISAAKRTFALPKKCGIDWLVSKCVYVESL